MASPRAFCNPRSFVCFTRSVIAIGMATPPFSAVVTATMAMPSGHQIAVKYQATVSMTTATASSTAPA